MCVVGSSHFLCLSTHDLFSGLFFKIKLNWGFCISGVLSLFSLVLHLIDWFNFLNYW